ncbi:MAG TPA: glycosyltransferase family 2 protein [Candidatus Marinimicrobia bacterium]|jgi:GT2 family glycosyltransferase|nr:glycosyltransferase family 2 protein [Candidatus Neomarinimicrobiota bacterium]HIA86706.1 glycosyltransferase family 2 protein [Candidatus Neomarinimicrobiota bacterium]
MPQKKVSVCIVTLNASKYLHHCLTLLEKSQGTEVEQIIVVDNRSNDNTVKMIHEKHSSVTLIQNNRNEGYTIPMNRAMKEADGEYLLILNPDAFVKPKAVAALANFLDLHPEVGIAGPKVLNVDGTFQKSCRRGVARPWNVISYFTGLAARFPDNSKYTGYHLSHLDENILNEVDGVSGSCMMIRRNLIDKIDCFDERFFAYQEDSDYCFRAKAAGWKIYYVPEAEVIHDAGRGGSAAYKYRSLFEWHRSYYLLYKKHFSADYFPLVNGLFYSAMLGKLLMTVIREAVRN